MPSRVDNLASVQTEASSMTAEMASELGKNIQVNVPAAPAQQSKSEVMQQPFTTKMPNGDPSLNRYMDRSFDW